MNDELLKSVLENLKNNKIYFNSGFKELDNLLRIPNNGAFILIGGRPCMGKTAFIFSIILNIVTKQEKILLFSPEYNKEMAVRKLSFLKAGINIKKYHDNKLNNKDFKALANAMNEMVNWNIMLDDETAIELNELERKIIEQKPKVVFIEDIDSIKLITDNSNKDVILSALQNLAHKHECLIFATTTLSRAPEERENHIPMLSDLKEYKSTRYADVVILLYREDYYAFINQRNKSVIAEIIVEKNKYNSTGCIRAEFDPKIGKFCEYTPPPELIF